MTNQKNTVQTAPSNGKNPQEQTSHQPVARPKNPTSSQLLARIVPMHVCADRRRPFGDC